MHGIHAQTTAHLRKYPESSNERSWRLGAVRIRGNAGLALNRTALRLGAETVDRFVELGQRQLASASLARDFSSTSTGAFSTNCGLASFFIK